MKKILFFLFILIFLSQMTFGYINIYPVKFDKRIDRGGSGEEFVLYNPTSNPLRYEIYLESDGIENSMLEWSEIYPPTISLQSGESKEVKIFVRSPIGVKNGEYMVTMGIKELVAPTTNSEERSQVRVLTHLKIDLKGYVGD